jgi:hypothetical protein
VVDHVLCKSDKERCAVIDGHTSMVPHGDGGMRQTAGPDLRIRA